MVVRIQEESAMGSAIDWNKISQVYELDTKSLPEGDRLYFEGMVKFLTGEKIRLSNIKDRQLIYFMDFADRILTMMMYPMVLTREYVRKEVARYMNELGLPLSIDALGFLHGPFSFKQEQLRQELIQTDKTIKEK